MSATEPAATAVGYASLGLVANPFAPVFQSATDPFWLRLVVHSAINRLHVAVEKMSEAERKKPILLELPDDVPDYYYVSAENGFLARTGQDARMNTLAANIGLDMMRLGKIRGTLAEMSELVAAVEFDVVMAAYAAAALKEPDTTLDEFAGLEGLDLGQVVEALEREPKEAAERYFGPPEYSRAEDEAKADNVLREAYYRSTALDADPEESPEAPEDVEGETYTPDLAVVSEDDQRSREASAVTSYVIAYARAHLSPVLARAMRAYVYNGFGAAAQELKVTKAPKKTLAAIIRFERYRFDRVVLMYDRFDPWDMLEEDARTTALGGLAELRHIISKDGVMVVLLPKDRYPELEEVFGGASRVDWAMRGVFALQGGETGLDRGLAQYWIDSASMQVPASIQIDDPLLVPIIDASHDDILIFAGMMALAVENAASRGLSRLDERAVEAASRSDQKE